MFEQRVLPVTEEIMLKWRLFQEEFALACQPALARLLIERALCAARHWHPNGVSSYFLATAFHATSSISVITFINRTRCA